MKHFVIFIAFLAVSFSLFGQGVSGPGIVSGKIVDSLSGQPIGYATVTALKAGSADVAGGIISEDNGLFKIDNLPRGVYTVKVDFIGYKTVTREGVQITAREPEVKMGTISLSPNTSTLKDVTVTGSRNFMENHLDKFVFNVEKDLTSQGGVATDILRKVPQVSVDVDGNVELLGSGNVRVFINGRPSTMFDNNLADALASIPASQIKSIEVISTPGAQYDAQGTGGIINIILKDNKSQGVNGSVALSAGTRLENGSANVHAKKGTIDLSASLSGNAQLKGATLNNLDHRSHWDSAQTVQNGQGTLEKTGYRGQLGVDWSITKKTALSASISFSNVTTNTNTFAGQQQFTFYPYSDFPTDRNAYNNESNNNLDWNLNFTHKFAKEGRELALSVQSSYLNGSTSYSQAESDSASVFNFAGNSGNNRLHDQETYVVADYAHPFAKDVILNIGVKGSFSRIYSYSDLAILDSSSNQFVPDAAWQHNFNFYRDVYAGYVSLSFPLGSGFSCKTGMRDEYTNISIPGDDTVSVPSYNSFIPSVAVSYKIDDNQNIKLAYSKRIQRAGYRQINPFLDATDPTNLAQGNPYLLPERSDVGELTYYRFLGKGSSILATFFIRYTRDDEQTYVLDTPSFRIGNVTYDNVTITTNENAGTQQLTGLNITGTVAFTEAFEVRCTGNIFDKYIVSKLVPGMTMNSFNYRINMNATYKFSKSLVAEFFGSFNSQRTEIQGKFPSLTTYSFAIRKMFMKNKAGLGFTTTDPFNRYVNQATDVSGPGFNLYSVRKIPYQSFGLTFNYKFGKMEYKEKKQEKDNSGDDSGF